MRGVVNEREPARKRKVDCLPTEQGYQHPASLHMTSRGRDASSKVLVWSTLTTTVSPTVLLEAIATAIIREEVMEKGRSNV
jgi:hypothetical protein